MSTRTRITAKEYLNSLSPRCQEKICSLRSSQYLYLFLSRQCRDDSKIASFAAQCRAVEIPEEYTNSPEALHYLAIAIANLINGNA